jgi:beta-galactosidase/beta-glucuronidase
MFRPDWLNLNGTWQFEMDPGRSGRDRRLPQADHLRGEILVPFCPESALSGIGNTEYMVHTWYRREFDVPPALRGGRLLLHFGAVDWHARVWVNGRSSTSLKHSPHEAMAPGRSPSV